MPLSQYIIQGVKTPKQLTPNANYSTRVGVGCDVEEYEAGGIRMFSFFIGDKMYTLGRKVYPKFRGSEFVAERGSILVLCFVGCQWIFKLESEPYVLALSAPESRKLPLLLRRRRHGPRSFSAPAGILKRTSKTGTKMVASSLPFLSILGS